MIGRYTVVLLMLGVSGQIALAQDQSFNPERSSGGGSYDLNLNALVTQSILRDLSAVRMECAKADRVYRPDCIRQGLELTSRRIPYHGDYGAMRQVLRQTSVDIASEISASKDPARDRLEIDPDTNVRFRSRRYYTPIQLSKMKAVRESIFESLDQSQSQLLKLADRSASWNKNYTAIAIGVSGLSTALR